MSTAVIFMCGTGGVGKTTSSVAMAMAQARKGERCLLMTIDPAQRLADALHLNIKDNVPTPIALPQDCKGSLSAMMLDAGLAFESFSQQYTSPANWTKLSNNRYFQFAKSNMGGIQEMMAVVKMIEQIDTDRYDMIVIDTPPAQNAQQFFEAPEKIQHLFSKSGLQWLTSKSSGFASINFAKSIIAKGLQVFLGRETMTDISDFFALFTQSALALENIARRGQSVLQSPTTAYWLVEVPHREIRQLKTLKTYLDTKQITITGRLLNKAPIVLPEIPNRVQDPRLRTLMKEIQQHQTTYNKQMLEQYTLQLPVTNPKNLESVLGLWEWSLNLEVKHPISPQSSPSSIH